LPHFCCRTFVPARYLTANFWQAFLNSLAMILVCEIGDKTFFIGALMAMQHPPLLVRRHSTVFISCVYAHHAETRAMLTPFSFSGFHRSPQRLDCDDSFVVSHRVRAPQFAPKAVHALCSGNSLPVLWVRCACNDGAGTSPAVFVRSSCRPCCGLQTQACVRRYSNGS